MKKQTNPQSSTDLSNHFLIAMPSLNGSLFGHSITFICEHNEQGAMGIVINHPLRLTLDDIFVHLKINDVQALHPEAILAGGPLHTAHGFVLHETSDKHWESTQAISENVSLTTSQDILRDIAHNKGPRHNLVALGCAGWGPGQLEAEIADNAWLTMPANSEIIFNTAIEHRAATAAAQLGINLALISPDAGHA